MQTGSINVKHAIMAGLAGAALTWFVITEGTGTYPPPAPEPDRPVLTFIARLAKSLLWVAVFADPPELQCPSVQQTVGADGYPTVSHARSL